MSISYSERFGLVKVEFVRIVFVLFISSRKFTAFFVSTGFHSDYIVFKFFEPKGFDEDVIYFSVTTMDFSLSEELMEFDFFFMMLPLLLLTAFGALSEFVYLFKRF